MQAAANAIATCGADRFLGVAGAAFAPSRYATDALAAEAICREAGATLILAPGTSRWYRTLPGVAHRLGGRADTHVTGLPVTDGSRCHRPLVLPPADGSHHAAHTSPLGHPDRSGLSRAMGRKPRHRIGSGRSDVEPPANCLRTTVTGFLAPAADAQTIRPDADLLFVAGAGWTKTQADGKAHTPEAADLILTFLRKTQASLGGSKSLVDLSGEGQTVLPFMTHLNQVGQTGATPRHPKGLATCCHGEEPHTVGWRFINERRAVNLDPNCGWARGKADVLYVADAFAVMAKVNALLAEEASA